jgi:hypothetical protein
VTGSGGRGGAVVHVAFVKTTITLLILFAGGACSNMDKTLVEVRGDTYEIPKDQIIGIVTPPDGSLHVRVAPEGEQFHLIIDEIDHYRPNRQGADVPTIARLNHNRFEQFTAIDTPSGKVVCGGSRPHFNCGLRVTDGNTPWSVLFDRDDLEHSEDFRTRAQQIIAGYRKQS